ncbi:hypothetical protein B9Z55_014269 [Caenorhabditis nigoni]|uniref:Uncharacterized protein n=2 Tax=Caenorhabditis nigoni TaxID=1611254 RepID=A0A2G5U5Q9_9PELO|nr:hypothetical protein B9Z55_014269 [Caenorhabditis nigoni]
MDKTHKLAVFISMCAFIFSIFFTIISGCSEYWARAEVIDTRKFRHAGAVHSGIFAGNREIDFGQGAVNTRFTVFNELQDGTSFFSRTVWIFFLFFESMSLIWSMIGVVTCVFSMTSLALDISVAGPNGIYLWSLLSSVSHGGALALFYSQFQSSFKTTMLLEEQHDIGFTTFNQASLSYAFYMSLCALFALYIPPLTLVVFTEKLTIHSRSKTPTNFDPTLMLY